MVDEQSETGDRTNHDAQAIRLLSQKSKPLPFEELSSRYGDRINTIETADIVKHAPTGEKWLVAYVEGDRLCACGWPETLAQLSDCTLVKKATEAEKQKLILELAEMGGQEYDSRRSWAKDHLLKAIA